MNIKIVTSKEGKAALCQQQFAVSSDKTPLGTTGLANCTGLVLFPSSGTGLSAVAHVEARTDKAEYRKCLVTALTTMLGTMKKQDGTGMSLVLLGAVATGMGGEVEDHAIKVQAIFRGLKFDDAEIMDLRNFSHYGVGSARLEDESSVPKLIGMCVFSPASGTLEVFGATGAIKPLDGVQPFRIQEAEGSVAAAVPKTGCCCTIL